MFRFSSRIIAIGLVVVATLAVVMPSGGAAQDGVSRDGHPLVGGWFIDEGPDSPPSLVFFSSDGAFQQVDGSGATGLGIWEATGPTTGNLTFWGIEADWDEGTSGISTIRATVEVSEDGMSFTATYTAQWVYDGDDSGELGPGTVTGTRMTVEPMGTPVASFDDFEEDEATPVG